MDDLWRFIVARRMAALFVAATLWLTPAGALPAAARQAEPQEGEQGQLEDGGAAEEETGPALAGPQNDEELGSTAADELMPEAAPLRKAPRAAKAPTARAAKPANKPTNSKPAAKQSVARRASAKAGVEPRAAAKTKPRAPAPKIAVEVGEQGPPQNARALLQKAYRMSKFVKGDADCQRMIELCETALESGELSPASTEYANQLLAFAHNRRGEFFAAGDENEAALAEFDTALEYDPKRWKAVHNRGVCHAVEGRYEEALADFAETLRLKPNYANAYFNRAELHAEQGDLEQALADYNQAVRFAPQDSEAYNSRGHIYFKLGKTDKAIRDFTKALEQSPDNAAAFTNRGDAYIELGRYGEAASDFKNALRIDPQHGRAYLSAAWLMSTCPDERYRHPQFALTAAKKALQLEGEDHRTLDALAAALANAGDFEQAARIEAKAVESAPAEMNDVYAARLARYEQNEPYREQMVADAEADEGVRQASATEPVEPGDDAQARRRAEATRGDAAPEASPEEPYGPAEPQAPAAAKRKPSLFGRLTGRDSTPPTIIDVRVEGNTSTKVQKIRPHVTTHAGRPLERARVEEDVRRLQATHIFAKVKADYRETPEGVVVVFQVTEHE